MGATWEPPINFGSMRGEMWMLPNPSGLNANYQLEDLVPLFRQVAMAAGLAPAPGPRRALGEP